MTDPFDFTFPVSEEEKERFERVEERRAVSKLKSAEPYSETQAIIELGKLDYERYRQANQRCLDAGGCPECGCVAAEQGREHWGHCSKAQRTSKAKESK